MFELVVENRSLAAIVSAVDAAGVDNEVMKDRRGQKASWPSLHRELALQPGT
jgi:hypothetical protein